MQDGDEGNPVSTTTQAGAFLAARRRRKNPQAAPNDIAASTPPLPLVPLPRSRRGRVVPTLRKTERFHPTQRDREASNRDSPTEKEMPPPAERSLYQRVPPVPGRYPRSPPNTKRIRRFPASHWACSTKGCSRRVPPLHPSLFCLLELKPRGRALPPP